MAIRVLLVDDQILTRMGLRAILGEAPGIEIAGEAESGREAVAQAVELQPDVTLMDLKMAGGDGIEATRAIKQHCPRTQVLILSVYADHELFRKAAAAGAAGYILKDISPQNLANAIRAVHQGKAIINPGLARQLLEDLAGVGLAPEPARRRPHGLTERELEVLVEVARGLSDKEIAATLYLSESTVKSHLRAIYRRLRLRNRAQAAAFVVEKNLLPLAKPGMSLNGAARGAPPASRPVNGRAPHSDPRV
jgi:NarL family two-component system response regulator LiaR